MNRTPSNYLKYLFVALFLFTVRQISTAQFLQVTDATTPPYTSTNLISNVFLGNGVDVTNIQYDGDDVAVGYFSGGTQSIGIDRGIIMTSGRASKLNISVLGADGLGNQFANNGNSSTAFDANLDAIASSVLNDVAVYTITFVPTSDTLRFKYCFASEEYPEYSCTDFNDVFGFFIQGPGYPTPTNIAKIPGTNLPVAINNIHPFNNTPTGPCQPFNAQYYNSNNNTNKQPVYDGFTDVFVAEAIVVPCQQYTIKLAIADVGDSAFDSGVFLEAKSFGTGSLRVDVATVSGDGTVTEGCADGMLTFKLGEAPAQNFPINYSIFGSALNGTDYQQVPSNLFIPAGQTEISVPIVGIEDLITEGDEFMAVDVQRDPCHRDTIYIHFRDNSLVPPVLAKDTTICLANAQPLILDGTVPVPMPPPPTFSNNQDFTISKSSPATATINSSINVFGVQPTTLGPGVIRSVCFNIDHTWDDDLDIFLISPGGQFVELSTDNGANGDNYTNTCFTPSANNIISFPGPFALASSAPFTGDWKPEGPWTDLWDGTYPANGNWSLQISDDGNGFDGVLKDWTITFEPKYQVKYNWLPATGLNAPGCALTNASPTQTTTYIVEATDTYGCKVDDSITVNVVDALAAPVIDCSSPSDNSIVFTWADVPLAIGYEVNINNTGWVSPNNGPKSHLITGLAPYTNVSIQVRAIGSLALCNALIGTGSCINCPAQNVTQTTVPVSCFGKTDGSITLNASGVNPPYSFSLNGNASPNGVYSNLAAGTYTAVVTDAAGCSAVLPISVFSPNVLAATTTVQQNVNCFGGQNGAVSVAQTGGTPGYTYQWNDPAQQSSANAISLIAGNYLVTVTDLNGCTTTASAAVSQPADLTLSTTTTNAKCFGSNTGAATVTGQGGTPGYQFAWSNGATGTDLVSVIGGNYTVTATDSKGCTEVSTVTIGQPSAIVPALTPTPPTCNGGTNGQVTATATGGNGTYTYKWSDPLQQTLATATGLVPQNYTVTITDGNGCTASSSSTVINPPTLGLAFNISNVSCFGGQNGTITANPSGGIGPYTYLWNDPANQTTKIAGNLLIGSYNVTVTDQLGCTGSATASLTQPSALQSSTSTVPVNCFGYATGTATITPNGGASPYTYNWSSGDLSATISSKLAGTYQVTVTDVNNCTTTNSATITQQAEIQIGAQVQDAKCFGENQGTIALNVSGGVPNYFAAWSGPNGFSTNGLNINNLYTGNYLVTVSDNLGCTKTLPLLVGQPAAALALSLPAVSDTICFLGTDGSATVLAAGGTAPYQYLWNANGISTPVATGLSSNLYQVTVTDANNCKSTAETFIAQRGQMFAWAVTEKPLCYNGADGTALVNAVFYGADPADLSQFTYTWGTSPKQNSRLAKQLSALQSYSVTVTDNLGCTATQTVTIGNQEPVLPITQVLATVKCHGGSDGSAAVSGSGGVAPYTYLWSPGPSVQTDAVAVNMAAGTYRVTATDANGCPATATATITEPTALDIHFNYTDVLCFGENSGTATALPSGGVPQYQLLWSNGQSGATINGIAAGNYSVTSTDQNGCTTENIVTVRQPVSPVSGTIHKKDAICFGSSNGNIEIIGAGGTPPYQYALNSADWNGSPLQIGLKAGVYTPRLVDRNGCAVSLADVQIDQNPAVLVDLGPDITIELGRDTQLLARVSNANGQLLYTWSPKDSVWLSCQDCSNPSVYNLQFPNYFEVQVMDELGCVGEDQVLVTVDKPRKVFVPTAFSPNDDLTNDLLMVHGQHTAKILSFKVYDRWGEIVYSTDNLQINDTSVGWDGKFRGQPMDPGVYVWMLEVEYLDGVKDVMKGNTTLIR